MGGVHMTIDDIEDELRNNTELYEVIRMAMNISLEEIGNITDYLLKSKNRQNLKNIV